MKGHKDWIQLHFLRSEVAFKAAKEGKRVKQLREQLVEKEERLGDSVLLLRDVSLFRYRLR